MKLHTITPSLLRYIRRSLRLQQERSFQVFCIGAAKTGTTSIAGMFRDNYLARHEPETGRTVQIVIDYLENNINRDEVSQLLLKRDARLNLELESSHPLGYLSEVLVSTFPRAKFIITIREPYSWLSSRLNFHHKVDPPEWRAYRDYFWTQQHSSYAVEEAILEKYGLCSLDTYLKQYADHYNRVLEHVPENRRIIIRTDEIENSMREIAEFAGVSPASLVTSHSNRSPDKITPLNSIDSGFIQEIIWRYCSDIIKVYFPETTKLYGHLAE